MLAQGIQIGEGFAMRLESQSPAAADLVDGRAFFANALADTDMVALPTPKGIQLVLQVRSAEAPEEVLATDVPAGAELKAVGEDASGELKGLAPGAAAVTKAGKLLTLVAPPVAWDADGEPLETSYRVSANKLVVSYPHRDADVHYPVTVDRSSIASASTTSASRSQPEVSGSATASAPPGTTASAAA